MNGRNHCQDNKLSCYLSMSTVLVLKTYIDYIVKPTGFKRFLVVAYVGGKDEKIDYFNDSESIYLNVVQL